jgi:uncharacterized protein
MNEAQVGFGFVEGPPAPGVVSLIHAARRGDCSAIALLLESGVDVNEAVPIGPWKENYTALMVAAGSADGAGVETVKLLLRLGADAQFHNDYDSAVTAALGGLWWNWGEGGDLERAKHLLEAGSPLPDDALSRGRVLCKAARTGDIQRVELLLGMEIDANGAWNEEQDRLRQQRLAERCGSGCGAPLVGPAPDDIPIFQAVASGNWELVQRLISAGAHLDRLDCFQHTAMYHVATSYMACHLNDAGLSFEHRGQFQCSPLMHAVHFGNMQMLRALIAAGADVRATHDHGYTLLMDSVGSSRMQEIASELLAAGLDPHAVSEFGYNAFHAGVDQDFSTRCLENSRRKFGVLRGLGIDIEHRRNDGMTPLAFAVQRGSWGEVQALCELGANPNAVCEVIACETPRATWVERPLLFASASVEKINSLLAAGADPLALDEMGWTPASRSLLGLVRSLGCEDNRYGQVRAELEKRLGSLSATGTQRKEHFITVAFELLLKSLYEFAHDDPTPDTSDREVQHIAYVSKRTALLLAHEAWARLNQSTGSASGCS